jgi:hypothetical protein
MKNFFLQQDVPNEFELHVIAVYGLTGPTGATGSTGSTGPTGATGATGSIGKAFTEVTTVSIAPEDMPYYMIISERSSADDTFNPEDGLPGIGTPITESLLEVADISNYPGDKKRMLDELHFLYIMGLAVIRGSKYYIRKRAIPLFYAPDGLFQTFKLDAPVDIKQAMLVDMNEHMRNYVLPGRWWRALYGLIGLSPAVQPVAALEEEMQQIEAFLEEPMTGPYRYFGE